MPNQWWTERMSQAEAAFVTDDAVEAARVLREMHDASGPQNQDQRFGVAAARETLAEAALAAERGELAQAQELF
jgi:hypothetical protein